MRQRKTVKFFSILEYEKEQEYLRRMHGEGWRFVRVSGIGRYLFEECEPEDVIYQLDYNQDGIHHKEEYVQMFRDCGWEYVQDYMGYSYFRKPAALTNGAEEIFCDAESRLQMLERVFKGRIIPLLLLFSAVLIPQFANNLFSRRDYPVAIVLGVMIALYLYIFGAFAVKYYQYRSGSGK